MYRVGIVNSEFCKMWPKLRGENVTARARQNLLAFNFMRNLSYSPSMGSFSKLKAFRQTLQDKRIKMKPLLNEQSSLNGSQQQIQFTSSSNNLDHLIRDQQQKSVTTKKKSHAKLLNKILSLKNTTSSKNKTKNDCKENNKCNYKKNSNSVNFVQSNYDNHGIVTETVDSVYIPLKDDTIIFQTNNNENFILGPNDIVEDIIYIIQKDAGDGTIVLQSNGENFDIDPGVIDGIYIPLRDPCVIKNCNNNDDFIKDANLKNCNRLDTNSVYNNGKDVFPVSCNLSVNGRQSVLSGYFTPDLTSPIAIRQYHTPSASPIMLSESCECNHNNQICDNGDNYNNTRISGSNSVERPAEGTRPECCGCVYSVDKGISRTLDMTMKTSKEVMEKKVRNGIDLYPNCDTSIWMRTCEEEVVEPIQGVVSGNIPQWIKGTLIRNGPGGLKVGDMMFEHLFDGSSLLHRFGINNAVVTYQSRYLKSRTFKKNHAANKIVVTEFGTSAAPDPCQTIFKRVSSIFSPGETLSDNAMISVYPYGDEFYAMNETPVIHRIDPVTLDTIETVDISKKVAIVNHTSHPHIMEDGTVYNQAMRIKNCVPHYSIVRFDQPKKLSGVAEKKLITPSKGFDHAEVLTSIKARWPLNPSYMHTFGMTDKFFIIVEQPMAVSVPSLIKSQIANQPLYSSLKFHKDKHTVIHLICRDTGETFRTYLAEAFFYLHIINQYEEDNHMIVDICCYSDPSMVDCMYIDAMKNINKNPDYARMFRGRPMRFILPLHVDKSTKASPHHNLVTIPKVSASAYMFSDGQIYVNPELLTDLGCETPRINYPLLLGKRYRYFYAISSDVDLDNPGTLIKVDIEKRTRMTWCEDQVYPSEPVFVPSPDPKSEDDGVILSALVWGTGYEKQVGLLVLCARTWTELGRTVFQTPGPVPKCLHGWFTPDY